MARKDHTIETLEKGLEMGKENATVLDNRKTKLLKTASFGPYS